MAYGLSAQPTNGPFPASIFVDTAFNTVEIAYDRVGNSLGEETLPKILLNLMPNSQNKAKEPFHHNLNRYSDFWQVFLAIE